jgi:ornithine cyclodeaminase/alanine dehydrogenase-like protein (mu-crystallin family)
VKEVTHHVSRFTLPMKLRILSAADVKKALPMTQAIEGMKEAFAQLSIGQAEVPLRSRVEVRAFSSNLSRGTTLVMPAHLQRSQALAVKIVSVFPHNPALDLPLIHGLVLVLDAESGQPLALLEGGELTAVRTGAGSGAATDLLTRSDAAVVAIIGSGVQARTQLEAVCTVRPIEEVRVYSPDQDHAAAFAVDMAGVGPIPDRMVVVDSAATAVTDADIICAATTSDTPVFPGSKLKPGAHVNGVGSYTPTMQEVDSDTIRRALVVVDARSAVLAEAGDLIIPIEQGLIDESHIHAELGEIVLGMKNGRTDPDQITYFKSVGVAVQDAIAGQIAYANALKHDLGTVVEL